MSTSRALLFLPLTFLLACPAIETMDDGGTREDAGMPADSGVLDAGVICTGACQVTTAKAQFGNAQRPFDRAQFGLTSPSNSSSGGWELHVELHGGGSSACPEQSSPTPDRTLIIAGLKSPLIPAVYATDAGIKATLFDFDGDLTQAPLLRAGQTWVDVTAANTCETCPGAERFIAFELNAAFDGGTVAGHVYGTHCSSLDTL